MFQEIAPLGIYFHSDTVKPQEIIYIWILKIIRVAKVFRHKEKSNNESQHDKS